jgi:outer membrane biosynthesis protein TonB
MVALAMGLGGCRRSPDSLGTMHLGAESDPKFDQAWRALAGDPSAEEVAAVVRANLPAVRTCYLRLTRAGSGVSGRAIVSFTVEKAGTVGDLRVDAPAFKDTGLPRCVSEQVQRWAFPQSKRGGLAVSYPFVFVGG